MLAALLLGSAAASPAAPITETLLHVATLAPKNSTWGKIYSTWAKAVETKTNTAVGIEILYNGVGGPSYDAVGRITSGKLDGASIGLADLSRYYRDVYALELPGTTTTWSDFDPVRATVQRDLAAALDANGIRFGWWEDWGRVHLFSRGFGAVRPMDLAGKRVASLASPGAADLIVDEILSMARARNPPPEPLLPLPPAPPDAWVASAMLARPWFRDVGVDHVGADVLWCGTGAMVFSKAAFASLPPDVARKVDDMSKKASRALAVKVRYEDEAAYVELTRTMAVVTHSPAEASEWKLLFSDVAGELANKKLTKAAVNRVLRMRRLRPVP